VRRRKSVTGFHLAKPGKIKGNCAFTRVQSDTFIAHRTNNKCDIYVSVCYRKHKSQCASNVFCGVRSHLSVRESYVTIE
jgi:hypothetical protein